MVLTFLVTAIQKGKWRTPLLMSGAITGVPKLPPGGIPEIKSIRFHIPDGSTRSCVSTDESTTATNAEIKDRPWRPCRAPQ